MANIILFGGTGDLVKKKLAPAFSSLINKGIIKKKSEIIGISRKKMSDKDYKSLLISSIKDKNLKDCIKNTNIKYFSTDVSKKGFLDGFFDKIKLKGPKIFYLSTSYELFSPIINEISKQKIVTKKCSIVFEKPFGSNLSSFEKIEKKISRLFSENQIYRIDHYLGKETVQNISFMRFANPFFEKILNNKFVEKIQVIVDENIGVGHRIRYYNNSGAIKDMIQNHLLQVLALLLMELPKDLSSDALHNEKVKALKQIKVGEEHLLGQYKSYKKELKKENLEDKKTETYAKINLISNSKRWKGTFIKLRTGKMLKEKYGKIIITLRGESKIEGAKKNRIIIDLQPKEDIKIAFNTKLLHELKVIPMDFFLCRACHFGPNTQGGYQKLIVDILNKDKTLFSRKDEVRASWKIVEEIEKIRGKIPFIYYDDYSDPDIIS